MSSGNILEPVTLYYVIRNHDCGDGGSLEWYFSWDMAEAEANQALERGEWRDLCFGTIDSYIGSQEYRAAEWQQSQYRK